MKRGVEIPLAGLGFRTHLLVYVLFGLVMMSLNFMLTPDEIWFHWPLLIWGIGLIVHAVLSFRRLTY